MSVLQIALMLPLYWLACEGSAKLDTVGDLALQYSNIFKTGNGNAASYLWAKFILDRADTMSPATVKTLFHGFCPISASPIPDDKSDEEYKVTLPRVGGGSATGIVALEWGGICDLAEHVRVDTKEIATALASKKFNFLVIGDPCLHEEQLQTRYTDASSGGLRSVAQDAPELACLNGRLSNAIFSDHGHPIIGMLFDDQDGAWPQKAMVGFLPLQYQEQTDMLSQDATWGFGKFCKENVDSRVGVLFTTVAKFSPIPLMTAKRDTPFFALKCGAAVFMVMMGVACIYHFTVRRKATREVRAQTPVEDDEDAIE